MIVQHNIMALNSHRYLTSNNSGLQKNLEKLSSGYRINRAADDAAGLSISQRMRAQIAGLERAQLNAKDGASLIQTAEGALTEVHSMLNRMKELGTQAANGTYGETDRNKIESELTALKEEIDRISEATNFNGINLLDGSLSSSSPKEVQVAGVKVTETAAVAGVYTFADVTLAVTDGDNALAGSEYSFNIALNNGDEFTFTFTLSEDKLSIIGNDGTKYVLTSQAEITNAEFANALDDQVGKSKLADNFIVKISGTDGLELTNRATGTAAPQVTGMSSKVGSDPYTEIARTGATPPEDAVSTILSTGLQVFKSTGGLTNEDTATFSVNGTNFILVTETGAALDNILSMLENQDVNIIKVTNATFTNADLQEIASVINQKTGMAFEASGTAGVVVKAPTIGNGLTMQVGDTNDAFNKITVSVDNMSAMGLGIGSITMTTQDAAARALERVNQAIEKVSVNRGNLGALQNRLEHTMNNLSVTTENLTESESRIRDTDMAKEMMAFTKNNVLSQAAQAMLAQANQQPQQVLQLLR